MTALATTTRGATLERRELVAMAWIGTLVLSRLPEIGLREILGLDAGWMPIAWGVAAVALYLAARASVALRPLAGYFAVLGGVIAATSILEPLIRQTDGWRSAIAAGMPPMVELLAERLLLVLIALAMFAVLAALGRGRPMYLAAGNVRAASGVRLPWMRRTATWLAIGPVATVLLAVVTASAAAIMLPPGVSLEPLLPLIPIAAAAAALNAFAEETLYRAAPVSQLAPAIGAGHAITIVAIWFGLGHFYGGIPSGPAGAIQAGAVALLFGKAMVDCRGLAWSWAMHFTIDLVIYSTLAVSIAAPAA